MTERRPDNSYYAQLNENEYMPTEDELIAEFIGQGFEFDEAKQLAKIRWSELEAERLNASFIRSKSSAKTTDEMFAEMDANQRYLEREKERIENEKHILDVETAERMNDLQPFLIALRRTGETDMANRLNAFILDTNSLFLSDNDNAFRTAYEKLILKKLKHMGNATEVERHTNIMNTYFQDFDDNYDLEYGGYKRSDRKRSHKQSGRKQSGRKRSHKQSGHKRSDRKRSGRKKQSGHKKQGGNKSRKNKKVKKQQ